MTTRRRHSAGGGFVSTLSTGGHDVRTTHIRSRAARRDCPLLRWFTKAAGTVQAQACGLGESQQWRPTDPQAAARVGNTMLPASFTLHKGDYGANGVVVLRVHQSFSVDTKLSFVVTEQPAVGAVRVLDRPGDNGELVYLASSRADAQTWLTRHGYPDAVLDEVTAESVEGRAVA